MIDTNTFRLILLAYDNGISSNVFTEYLYTFIVNNPSIITKRTHQIHWIVTNINTHQHKWHYFDIYHRPSLFFNGLEKSYSHVTHCKHLKILHRFLHTTQQHTYQTHTGTHTNTIHPIFLQFMDSQMNSKLLHKILEDILFRNRSSGNRSRSGF